jgi:glycosyltransferase involved in cell wall biosynthesis
MDKPLIFFDVTHTLGHPHMTGVQRVTRCLAAEMVNDPRVRLVRFDRKLQRFLILTNQEVTEVTGLPKGEKSGLDSRATNGYRRLVMNLRRFALFLALASAKDWFVIHVVHQAQSSLARIRSRRLPSPLDGGRYLTSEVVGEMDRTKTLHFLRRRRNTHLSFVVHDLIPMTHPEFSLVDQGDFRRYLSLIKHAQRLICDSGFTEDRVREFLATRDRRPQTSIALPGFGQVPAAFGSESVTPWTVKNSPLVVWVGTIEPRKNQATMLHVLKKLWESGLEFRFVFAGNPGRRSEEFAERFYQLHQEGYPIHWIRGASEDQIRQLYSHAAFTVYLSLVEGYGLPVLESLASGTPCLTSSGTSMAEIASLAGGCVLVDPKDQKAIQTQMTKLLTDTSFLETRRASIDLSAMPTWAQYKKKVCDLVSETPDLNA